MYELPIGALTKLRLFTRDMGGVSTDDRSILSASDALTSALAYMRTADAYGYLVDVLRWLGLAYIGLGERRAARVTFGEMLELSAGTSTRMNPDLARAMSGIALSVGHDHCREGARLYGALAKLSQDAGRLRTYMWKQEGELERRFEQPLIEALGDDEYRSAHDEGRALTFEEALAPARSLEDS